jgi:nucleoside-diphosphate-sugar epimerase
LVTGAAGFIGSNLVQQLLARGERVRGIDNFLTGKRANLTAAAGTPGSRFEFFEGDICKIDDARRAVDGVDFVLHQAALPSVPRSVDDPLASNHVNVNGTLTMLVAARDAKVKRFVYAASSSAYGNSPSLPKVETMTPNPLSPYAVMKLVGEYYCRVFHEIYGLPAVSLRYFNVFGPRQDPHSQYAAVIPRFIDSLLRGTEPRVFGDGEQSRDFTYIENVVNANLLACSSDKAVGQVINVACGERYTLNDLLSHLMELTGRDVKAVYDHNRAGDVKHSMADIGKARSLLGYEPVVSFREGLRHTVDFFKGAAS